MFQSTKQKRISYAVFSIYLILLVWLVLFKFTTNLSALPSMRSINLIPFHYTQETNMHLKEVLYNMIVFIPLGVYVHIFKNDWKILRKCTVIFLTSFLFEVIQFIFAIGASDITDIIGNTLGGIAGIILCTTMKHIVPKKFTAIINCLGILIETTAIGFIVLLWVSNS